MTNSFKTNLHQRRARSRWPLSPRHWRPAPSYRGPRRGGRRPLGGRGGKKQLRRTPMRRRRHHRRCCCCRSQHWRQRPSLLSAALFVAADAGTHRERCQRHYCEEQERQQRGEEPADGATKPAASFSFFLSIRSERKRASFFWARGSSARGFSSRDFSSRGFWARGLRGESPVAVEATLLFL